MPRPRAVQALLDAFPGALVVGEPVPERWVNRCAICGVECSGDTCRLPCTDLYLGFRFAMDEGRDRWTALTSR